MVFLVNLAIAIIIVGVVAGVLVWAINSLTIIPEPFRQVGRVVIILIACLLLLGMVFGHVGGGLHFIGGSL
jgi:hypothetical protein